MVDARGLLYLCRRDGPEGREGRPSCRDRGPAGRRLRRGERHALANRQGYTVTSEPEGPDTRLTLKK